MSPEILATLLRSNRNARVIVTSDVSDIALPLERTLYLRPTAIDKWALLTDFLRLDYPSHPYSADDDLGKRPDIDRGPVRADVTCISLKSDASPWIIPPSQEEWTGISVDVDLPPTDTKTAIDWSAGDALDTTIWNLRDDTFPSNQCLFRPENFNESSKRAATLTLRQEETLVRKLTAAAIATRGSYLYGSFSATLRPPRGAGLITGMFLHRNGPRQEIDIEVLGRDTTKMLVNVYYNPGPEGTKLEYGYRGTPTLVELGFDAADDFHTYEINWQSNAITWSVDGIVLYQRVLWNPTPIPDQPLQFNVNLWHSRSDEFAGRLTLSRLPASLHIRSVEFCAVKH